MPKPRVVIDIVTGEEWKSARVAARYNNMKGSTLRKYLSINPTNLRYKDTVKTEKKPCQ